MNSRLADAERAASEKPTARHRASPLNARVIRVSWSYEWAEFRGEIKDGINSWICRDTTPERLKSTARSSFPNDFLVYTYDEGALAHMKFNEVLNATR